MIVSKDLNYSLLTNFSLIAFFEWRQLVETSFSDRKKEEEVYRRAAADPYLYALSYM